MKERESFISYSRAGRASCAGKHFALRRFEHRFLLQNRLYDALCGDLRGQQDRAMMPFHQRRLRDIADTYANRTPWNLPIAV